MDEAGIVTAPDFNSVWIDSQVALVPAPESSGPETAERQPQGDGEISDGLKDAVPGGSESPTPPFVGGAIEDPTYRIGKLDAANTNVVSVVPNHPLEMAVTQMLENGFSQLPVMQGDRGLKGVVTWESIGARLAIGKTGTQVKDFMAPAQVIASDKSLFAAIEIIAQHQYVLVQASDNRISGIVTSADLSRQFQQLTEPFLLLAEIEQHIRKLLVGKFTVEDLESARDPNDAKRSIQSVANLSMGEYIRLVENPKNWEKLALRIDRGRFVNQLTSVRDIRNEVMHFNPDPPDPNDLLTLRKFVLFMQSLRDLGAF